VERAAHAGKYAFNTYAGKVAACDHELHPEVEQGRTGAHKYDRTCPKSR